MPNSWAYVQLEMSPKVVAVCFQGLARRSHQVRRRFVNRSREKGSKGGGTS